MVLFLANKSSALEIMSFCIFLLIPALFWLEVETVLRQNRKDVLKRFLFEEKLKNLLVKMLKKTIIHFLNLFTENFGIT